MGTEDAAKLGVCNDCNVEVISSDYLLECDALKTIIPFNEYSMDEYKTNDSNIWHKLIKNQLFIKPCQESLEYESIPQTIQDFNECKWIKPTPNKSDTIYILPIDSDRTLAAKNKEPPTKKRKMNT